MKKNLAIILLLLIPDVVHAVDLKLFWSDNSANETEFHIYRKLNPVVNGIPQNTGAYFQVGKVGSDVTTYVDSTSPIGNQACFQVTAANATGESPKSNEACTIVGVILGSIIGQTQAQADAALKAIGLVLGTVTTQSSATVPAGQIISQSPVATTTVAPGSTVNIVVSSGPVATIPLAPSGVTIQ